MVGRVLNGNGITRYGDRLYTLVGAEELSNSERDTLLQLCRQRLDGFREQRGEEVFAHRSRHRSPISGSVKDRALTRAPGRCDFRGVQTSFALREAGCVFCALEGSSRVLLERPQPGESAAACCGWDGIAPA
jgi:ATP adenylyltransferase